MMKKGIHPEYGEVTIKCSCGNEFKTRSTRQGTMNIEICARCHPFYSGKKKIVDTAGRIEKFKTKYKIK